MFDLLSQVDWEVIIAVAAMLGLGFVGVRLRKYLRYFHLLSGLIEELSDALQPDKDNRIRITKHEIRRIVLRAQSFLE